MIFVVDNQVATGRANERADGLTATTTTFDAREQFWTGRRLRRVVVVSTARTRHFDLDTERVRSFQLGHSAKLLLLLRRNKETTSTTTRPSQMNNREGSLCPSTLDVVVTFVVVDDDDDVDAGAVASW